MSKTLRVLLVFFCASTWADVDSQFGSGVAGCGWGDTLQQVQAKHPGGFAWPNQGNEFKGEVVYAVTGAFVIAGVETASPLVHFVFSKDNELQRAFFHFKPADRDIVLYQVAQLLGQDYSIRDQAASREFDWKRGRTSFARFEIGNGPDMPWVYLGVRSMKDGKWRQR